MPWSCEIGSLLACQKIYIVKHKRCESSMYSVLFKIGGVWILPLLKQQALSQLTFSYFASWTDRQFHYWQFLVYPFVSYARFENQALANILNCQQSHSISLLHTVAMIWNRNLQATATFIQQEKSTPQFLIMTCDLVWALYKMLM